MSLVGHEAYGLLSIARLVRTARDPRAANTVEINEEREQKCPLPPLLLTRDVAIQQHPLIAHDQHPRPRVSDRSCRRC